MLAVRINGDPRVAFDTVKRVVEENRGRVVCCYENVMIAAYNLLSAGGHHQLRAADTVARLRARLDGVVPFVAAIHHGKLSALVSASDGVVMATGEVIQTCRVLLARANEMSRQAALAQAASAAKPVVGDGHAFATTVVVSSDGESAPAPSPADAASPSEVHHAVTGPLHGLCLLYCQAEMSLAYDCEAVDIEVRVVGAEREVNSSIVATTSMSSATPPILPGGLPSVTIADTDEATRKAILAHLGTVRVPNTGKAKTSSRVVYRLAELKGALNNGKNMADQYPLQYTSGSVEVTNPYGFDMSKSPQEHSHPISSTTTNEHNALAVLLRANTNSARTVHAAAHGADDEWMYQLKDDQSAHSAVNLIFTRLQSGDVAEAGQLYRRLCEDQRMVSGLSDVARRNLGLFFA